MKFLVFLSAIILVLSLVTLVRGVEQHHQNRKIDNVRSINRLLDLLLRIKQQDSLLNQQIKSKDDFAHHDQLDNKGQVERTCK